MAKTTLDGIISSLESIHSDLEHALDELEGEAPEYMKFRKANEAKEELEEQIEIMRKWLDGFSIGNVEQNIY